MAHTWYQRMESQAQVREQPRAFFWLKQKHKKLGETRASFWGEEEEAHEEINLSPNSSQ